MKQSTKTQLFNALERESIIGIIRTNNAEDAKLRAKALLDGGIKLLEVSLSTPNAVNVIRELALEADEGVFIGAGTVLDAQAAYMCINNGASFIIAPNFSRELIETCNRYNVACIPGVGSATEIVTAMEYGVDVVKLFPASVYGTEFIKAVSEPLPQSRIIPVGGVSIRNMADWFAAGAYAVALGSGLTRAAGSQNDIYTAVKENAKTALQELKRIRGTK